MNTYAYISNVVVIMFNILLQSIHLSAFQYSNSNVPVTLYCYKRYLVDSVTFM